MKRAQYKSGSSRDEVLEAKRAYASEQVAVILGHPVILTDAQVTRIWALLTREEELNAPHDIHGNFTVETSSLAQAQQLEHPPLHDDLLALGAETPIGCWPKPYRFAACLTHDVDVVVRRPWRERWRRTFDPRITTSFMQRCRWGVGALYFRLLQMHKRGETSPYEIMMCEEARHDFHSTFFVMPEWYRYPTPYDHFHRYQDPVRHFGAPVTFKEASRQTHAMGWEIGLHGSYASAYDSDTYNAEKQQLEEMLGAPVESGRQHYLRFNIEVTPQVWAQSGIRADSTMGGISAIGYRSGLAFPYFWHDAGDVLEVPLCLHDVSLFHSASQYDNGEESLERTKALIERVAKIGGLVTLSWHTHSDIPDTVMKYRSLLELIANLGGWGCTLRELNAWWRQRREGVRRLVRAARVQRPSYSNKEVTDAT